MESKLREAEEVVNSYLTEDSKKLFYKKELT